MIIKKKTKKTKNKNKNKNKKKREFSAMNKDKKLLDSLVGLPCINGNVLSIEKTGEDRFK